MVPSVFFPEKTSGTVFQFSKIQKFKKINKISAKKSEHIKL